MVADIGEGQQLFSDMKQDRKDAEYYLLHYVQELKAYEAAKKEAEEAHAPKGDNIGGKSNLPGKPTEVKALASITFDENYPAYLWLKAVEYVQRGLGERKNIFIDVRREAEKAGQPKGRGRRGWVVYTQMHYIKAIQERFLCEGVYVSEVTVKRWWQEIISRVIEIYLRLTKK